jgi:hypothetical protein
MPGTRLYDKAMILVRDAWYMGIKVKISPGHYSGIVYVRFSVGCRNRATDNGLFSLHHAMDTHMTRWLQ